MTQAHISLFDSISSFRNRHFLPDQKHRWSLGGARTNPDVRDADQSLARWNGWLPLCTIAAYAGSGTMSYSRWTIGN